MIGHSARRASARGCDGRPRRFTRSDAAHDEGFATTVGTRAVRPVSAAKRTHRRVSRHERAGYAPGEQIAIALDPATTELYGDGRYTLARENRALTGAELTDFWADWADRYPIVSIEDGLAEDDWEGWVILTERLGGRIQLVGDDLLVTNTRRLERAIREAARRTASSSSSTIGTLTETVEAVEMAQRPDGRRSSATAPGRPRTRRSPTWRSRSTPASQDRLDQPVRADRQVQPLLRIEEDSATRPSTQAGRIRPTRG